jgi:hypothetical protein
MAEISQQEVRQFFYDYVGALKSGDDLFALNQWSLLDRTWCDQLGIRYSDAPLKIEAGSLLMHNLNRLKSGAAKLSIDTVTMSRGFARIDYRITARDTTLTGTYYAITTATVEPSLTSPLRVYTESWEQARGKYFDLTFRDLTLLEKRNADATDQFIETTAKTLGISEEKMTNLERAKFRIILCESYGEVQLLTGVPAHGDFLKPLDAVVSKFLPPYHEIAQFLVSYAIDSLPYYTLPFIEAGTATFLGGRWGRSAEVMLYIGSYIYGHSFHEWDKLVTYDGFRSFEDNPDFSYPVAGLFCQFLFDKLDREKYFLLYRRLSGTEAAVKAMTPKKFQDVVAGVAGTPWVALETEFKRYAAAHNYAGIAGGGLERGKLVYESGTSDFTMRILEDSADYNAQVVLKSGEIKAALIIGAANKSEPYQSFLYKEYFADSSWQHQRYALIFSANEVGVYDFFTNVITGKYSVGFGGGDPIFKPGSGLYRFRIDKRLLPDLGDLPVKLIPLK